MERSAQQAENLAVYFCKKGCHRQAEDLFLEAAKKWEQEGKCLKAAAAYAQAFEEHRWARPEPPVNISALVD